MWSFAEVLANNQTKNINENICNEIGKKLETFNDDLIAYKAKSSTGVATISINPNKTKAMGAATISGNSKRTSRPNASVEDDKKVNKKVVRETGDIHPPAEDELFLRVGSDMDEQIDGLVDTTNSTKVVNFANNDESEPEGSNEDDRIKDIVNDFSAMEKNRSTNTKKIDYYNKH